MRRARHEFAALRSTRRTTHREIDDRPGPAPGEYRRFGEGSAVVPPCGVAGAERVTIGANVLLHEGASILVADTAEGVEIGDGTVLARSIHIACSSRVSIGTHVSSSDHIAIVDSWGPFDRAPSSCPPGGPVIIEDGAYLGFGCIIGPGVRIGAGAFVGEGAVVLDDVAAHSVVYGNPARVIRHLTDERWDGARFP